MAERLQERLPLVIREYKESQVIADTQEKELRELWACLKDAEADQFVTEATVYGVRRWEQMMRLAPSGTLKERKQAILTQLNYKLPYTYRRLLENMTTLCGEWYVIELEPDGYILDYTLFESSEDCLTSARHLLKSFVPANLLYRVRLEFDIRELLNKNRFHLQELALAAAFDNFGRAIRFNGERYFDGKDLFDQKLMKGLDLSDLNIALGTEYRTSLEGLIGYELDVNNVIRLCLNELHLMGLFQTSTRLSQADVTLMFSGPELLSHAVGVPAIGMDATMAWTKINYHLQNFAVPMSAVTVNGLALPGAIINLTGANNEVMIGLQALLAAGVISCNQQTYGAIVFDMATGRRTSTTAALPDLVMALKASTNNWFESGRLVKDSMHHFDGSRHFDGSFTFDPKIIEEDI